ncbi:MAG: bifunctional phosphopantothenoylcysteine decarboxylase/phosphopantothenate--cysteine ligase CoaBC [Candidatus Glassbacteria bacterium]|nr:bifunctional phosphopantothenoylcysteine decarboxylase/phosphopantothenate--cysteine ligase CoaBC [Candidatus Glassbacteria bacterium]
MENRRILIGLSGGIACYKSCELVSCLVRSGAEVRVVMTGNAARFVGPVTLQALSGNPVRSDIFSPIDPGGIEHVSLAEFAEVFVISPATADCLAKLAHGIADDLLSTTYLACDCPVLAVPAMNTVMYEHPATQANLAVLEARGVHLMLPESGRLACGTEGVGRLPGFERIVERIEHLLCGSDSLAGLTVLVSAGPTREALDPVRYLTNASSGKMGFAVAASASRMGAAKVNLVTGPCSLPTPHGVSRHDVVSADQMYKAVSRLLPSADLLVMAAAVSDFTPLRPARKKMKKGGSDSLTLELKKTRDILAYCSSNRKPGAVVVGFALETENDLDNAAVKLRKKKLDYIVVNNALEPGSGPGSDTNRVTVLGSDGTRLELPVLTKRQVAEKLLELIAGKRDK